MSGNPKKFKWNRPGTVNRQPGKSGSTLASYEDAVDLETAVLGVNLINARKRRDTQEGRAVMKAAEERRKITLPSFESLAKLLEEIRDVRVDEKAVGEDQSQVGHEDAVADMSGDVRND